jgi:hypothetical protein
MDYQERGENNYALYITVGAVLFVLLIVSIWIYRAVDAASEEKNEDPRTGYVCLENSCSVKKICDNTTLVIETTPPNGGRATKQRVPYSNECT